MQVNGFERNEENKINAHIIPGWTSTSATEYYFQLLFASKFCPSWIVKSKKKTSNGSVCPVRVLLDQVKWWHTKI